MKTTEQLVFSPMVLGFAEVMQEKLDANNHKSGWEDMSRKQLLRRLDQEVSELRRLLLDPKDTLAHRRKVDREAADVANFAAFIASNFGERNDDD